MNNNQDNYIKINGYDKAVEYALSIFTRGRLSNNLDKTKKDLTQKFEYHGRVIGCVYYINRGGSNYASFEFVDGYFDPKKFDTTKYDFEDRTIYYSKKAAEGKMPKNPNIFKYKFRFQNFDEVRPIIEKACELIKSEL